MSYSAPNRLLMPMRHSLDTINDSWLPAQETASGAGAWPSANLAIYVPLRVPSRVVVRKLWIGLQTTGAGNADMGLYDASGVAVISATGASTVEDEMVFDVTDTTIGPGLYYVAASLSSTSDTSYRTAPGAPMARACGVLTEASAYPLPSTATWAADNTLAYIPLMGILLEATVA